MKISIIVPCYNEELSLLAFHSNVTKILDENYSNNYEIVFIDDGSSDQTLSLIKKLCENSSHVEYLSFSRNFGKEAAMLAGMKAARGKYIVIMDVDLQDPPELLPKMLEELEKGEYDCVATRRVSRKGEPIIRSFCARAFYRIINRMSDIYIVDGARDFRMMTRQMAQSIIAMPERNRFSKGLFAWVGFKTKWLEYENCERLSGESKWSFWGLFKYSVEGILAFSTVPLAIASWMGVLLFIASFCAVVFFVIQKLFVGIETQGWATMMCMILMLGGMQLLCIGILGQYMAKTYLETKNRPLYIVRTSSAKEE